MSMADWVKHEVELACKRENPDRKEGEWDYGCACYESALKAYQSLMEDGHSGMSFSFTKNILIRLMEGLPLTPIEDVPESWNLAWEDEENRSRHYQCTRMSSLFKHVAEDGTVTFSANNYYCIDKNSGLAYSGGGAEEILSRYVEPIVFPYYPRPEKYKIVTEEYLTDRKNGDFDTKAYLWIKTPDGERINVYEYYGEVDGKWRKLREHEFIERKRLHNIRVAKEEADHIYKEGWETNAQINHSEIDFDMPKGTDGEIEVNFDPK